MIECHHRTFMSLMETFTNTSSRDVVRIEGPSVFADAVSFVPVRFAIRVISAGYFVARCYEKKNHVRYILVLLLSRFKFIIFLPLHGIWGGVPTKPDSHSQ